MSNPNHMENVTEEEETDNTETWSESDSEWESTSMSSSSSPFSHGDDDATVVSGNPLDFTTQVVQQHTELRTILSDEIIQSRTVEIQNRHITLQDLNQELAKYNLAACLLAGSQIRESLKNTKIALNKVSICEYCSEVLPLGYARREHLNNLHDNHRYRTACPRCYEVVNFSAAEITEHIEWHRRNDVKTSLSGPSWERFKVELRHVAKLTRILKNEDDEQKERARNLNQQKKKAKKSKREN